MGIASMRTQEVDSMPESQLGSTETMGRVTNNVSRGHTATLKPSNKPEKASRD